MRLAGPEGNQGGEIISLDYERWFRASERLFSMGTNQTPNHGHEHAMGKQNRYILVQDTFSPGLSWTAVAA